MNRETIGEYLLDFGFLLVLVAMGFVVAVLLIVGVA